MFFRPREGTTSALAKPNFPLGGIRCFAHSVNGNPVLRIRWNSAY